MLQIYTRNESLNFTLETNFCVHGTQRINYEKSYEVPYIFFLETPFCGLSLTLWSKNLLYF